MSKIITDKILRQINKIYYKDKYYPRLKINRPWSKDNPEITGELSIPGAYAFYLQRELINLLEMGAEISVVASRPITNPHHAKILDYIDEQHLDLRNKKIFLFSPERVEISAERLEHYTGTKIDNFQSHILATNYNMHLEIFAKIFPDCIKPSIEVQMPTYHYVLPDNQGISIVNIGVGPSNAKIFMDHVCVLKPNLVLMVGHCGGLRNNQKIGDFVLASSYLRDDKILDEILPLRVPVVPHTALNNIIMNILDSKEEEYRIGCIFTTGDRNWEFNKEKYIKDIALSRSIGIDTESATIAANGYRYRVPNATLLMVSDKPLHGALKRTKESIKFYKESKQKHVEIAVKIIEECRKQYPYGFPSNTIRGLYDPLMVSQQKN